MGHYTYTLHDPRKYTDAEIEQGLDLQNAVQAEAIPEDPLTPLEQAIAQQRAMSPRLRRRAVRAWSPDGELVGTTGIRVDPDHDDNPDLIFGNVTVRADHRRQGVGTQLLAYFVALAKQEARVRIVGQTHDRLPAGGAFAQALGAEAKQWMHMNHLPIANVDVAKMQQWVADGPVRAKGYEIIGWDGNVPEEYMEKMLAAILVMNTAPRDDLVENDFTLTAEQVREDEKMSNAAGFVPWQLIARRVSDGAWAGIHDVTWNPSEPDFVYVGATGVFPEHRGHALGKWLKAVMTLRVMEERPNVTHIRTGNADSNDAMLGINHEMGYEPFIASTTWELATEHAEKWLAAKGVALPEV
jgi:GNAT superfamily N-acetyltransferase